MKAISKPYHFPKLWVMFLATAILTSVAAAAPFLHPLTVGQLNVRAGFVFVIPSTNTSYVFAFNQTVGLIRLTNDSFIVDDFGISVATSPINHTAINITHFEPNGDSLLRASVQAINGSTMFFNFTGVSRRTPYQFLVDGQSLPLNVSDASGAIAFVKHSWSGSTIELRLVVSPFSTLAITIIGIFTLLLIVIILLFTLVWIVEKYNEYKEEVEKGKWRL